MTVLKLGASTCGQSEGTCQDSQWRSQSSKPLSLANSPVLELKDISLFLFFIHHLPREALVNLWDVSFSRRSNGVPYPTTLTTQQLMYVVIFHRALYTVSSSTSSMGSSPTCILC